MSGHWVYGAIAVLTLLHGIALLYAYRNGSAAGKDEEPDPEEYVGEDGIECPSCGERNDTGYRFCRRCVAELPGQMSFMKGTSAPGGRRTL